MANIAEILASRNAPGRGQTIQTGTVLNQQRGRYNVVIGGHRYLATLGIAGDLDPGDVVAVVLGRGEPHIISKLGRDVATL